MRILLAEDELDLALVITKILTKEGYSVDTCHDGEEALYFLEHTEYDAAVLDIMMPKRSGIDVLRSIRHAGNTVPVLFLTARDSIEQRVEGLDAGANDYLIKPFAFPELLARIRVLLRQTAPLSSSVIHLANLTVDLNTREVKRDNTAILLSSKEFSLLEYLIRNQGIVLSRKKIEEHVWSYDYDGASNMIDVYIRYLRKKIDDPFTSKLIHTVRGIGYVLKEE